MLLEAALRGWGHVLPCDAVVVRVDAREGKQTKGTPYTSLAKHGASESH